MPDCRWYAIQNRIGLASMFERAPPGDRAGIEAEIHRLFLHGPRTAGVRALDGFGLGAEPNDVLSMWRGRIDVWFTVDERECVLFVRLALPAAPRQPPGASS